MGVKKEMEKAFGVKNVKGEYVTKKEYNEYRRQRKSQISEEWMKKKIDATEKNIVDRRINSRLGDVTKKFFMDIKEFVDKYKDNDDHSTVGKIGHDIICDYIIRRGRLIFDSHILPIPYINNEPDLNKWFEDYHCTDHKNCAFSILGLKVLGRHIKGIDYMCEYRYEFCCPNDLPCPYIPIQNFLDIDTYDSFNMMTDPNFLIELEYVSSNFIKHRHPNDIVDMIICYKKDIDIGDIPILELSGSGRLE